jgi:hypothetical protein
MAHQSLRDPIVALRDQSDYTGWLAQLQARCVAHSIWDKISLDLTEPLLKKLVLVRALIIADYTPAANVDVPERQSELLTSG